MEFTPNFSQAAFDILVIGGGPAGVTAALRARELGARVALVERGLLGGTCTNDGCVPTRVLAKAARLRRDAAQFDRYGLSGEVPEVEFQRLLQHTQQTVYKIHEKKQLADHLEQAGVHTFSNAGRSQFTDAHAVVLADGTELRSDKFILATGGHARRTPFPGSEYILTHSDVWSLPRLPRSVIVVGAAGTGCQLASILSGFGVKVTLLNRGTHILPTEDVQVSEGVTAAFQRHGIDVLTGIEELRSIERIGNDLTLSYTREGRLDALSADAVVMAIGWEGNVEGLGLEAAGVKTAHGYIVVDDFLQTTAPHIFAAGDVTGRMMLVQSGVYEGRFAAENAVLGMGQPYRHQIVPHGGFTDPEYGSVGLTEAQAGLEQDAAIAVVPYMDLDRAVIDGHTEGFCKLIVSRETHRILGAHIVGEQALEAIQVVATAMAADMWVEQLAEVELAYPTFTSIVGIAARQVCQELGVIPLAPEWRAAPVHSPRNAEWEWTDA